MRGEQYRLKTPTLAIIPEADDHDHGTTITIPEGGVVEVVEVSPDGNGMVDVRWKGRAVMMFVIDLRTRGERVTDHVGASGKEPARR